MKTFAHNRYRMAIFIMKVASKMVILAIVVSIFYVTYEPSSNTKPTENDDFDIGTHAQKGYEAAIKDSTIDGIDQDNHKYKIHSELLIKTRDNQYQMQNIDGVYLLDSGDTKVSANSGAMHEQGDNIDLFGNIKVERDDYALYSEYLKINFKNMTAETDQRASIVSSGSKISSDKLNADNKNGILRFEGNVSADIKISDF